MSEYNAGYLVGIIFGVFVMCAAVLIFLRLTRKEHSSKNDYDERQMLVRGKGDRYAFVTLFVYNLIYVLFGDYIELIAVRSVVLFMGIILSTWVYVVYTVWNDGYFSLNEKPKSWIGIFAAIAIVNTINGIQDMYYYGVIQNGVISETVIGLMEGCCIFFILAVIMAKSFLEKREGQNEE